MNGSMSKSDFSERVLTRVVAQVKGGRLDQVNPRIIEASEEQETTMDRDTKIVFGKLLGEIYRTQEMLQEGSSRTTKDHIYGLLNGIEWAIDVELERVGFVGKEETDAVMDVLTPIFDDQMKLEEFKGYYDIESDLEKRDVSRDQAIVILTHLKASGKFVEVIEKMDSCHSPVECKRFEIWDPE